VGHQQCVIVRLFVDNPELFDGFKKMRIIIIKVNKKDSGKKKEKKS